MVQQNTNIILHNVHDTLGWIRDDNSQSKHCNLKLQIKSHAYKSETILFFNSDWVLASSDKRVLKFSYIFSDFFLSELYIHSLYLINLVCYLIFCKKIFIKISEKAVKLFEVS